MSNAVIRTIAWVGLGLHVIFGTLAIRSAGARLLVPVLNFVVAACVVAYWVIQWYGYLFRGIRWSASDQLIPLYAILVCVLAGGTLAGRYTAVTLNWLVFAGHAIVFVGAVMFVTFFRLRMF